MTALFSTVLQTSIYATIVGIVILITKHFLRDKLNAKWQYLIWSVLILKLLVPFGPESAVSLFNTVPEIPKTVSFSKAYEQVQLDITEKQLKASTITPELIAKSKSLSFAKTVEVAIPYIWGIGVILMLLWLFYTYYSMNQKLAKGSIAANERILTIFQNCKVKIGVSKDIEILIQDIVGSPSLFGIIHPKILLVLHVENFTDKEIEYILLHELAHYQRKDVLVNYLLLTMQLVHWFNPLMWYCFKCIRQDMEVATDEKVLLTLEKKEHIDYGKVLLMVLENISVTRLAPKLIGMVDDKKNMKRRIKMIKMSDFFKSRGRVVLVVGLLCVAVLGSVMLTNGIRSKNSTKDSINYNAEVLFKSKTAYVGNNSKVGGVINNLPYANLKKGFSLQTKDLPYGVTVNYDLSKENIATQSLESDLRNNAIIMFSLIDNVDVINFNVVGNNGEPKYQYTRELLQKSFEKDLREYSKDIKSFEGFINNYSLRLFAYPGEYSPMMSSTPGIRITAEYPGIVHKVRYSTNLGSFLNWESVTGKINEKGSTVELPYDMPVYWGPLNGTDSAASGDIFVKVEILDKNNKVLEAKQINIKYDKDMRYKVQASSDVVIGVISKPKIEKPKTLEAAVSLAIKDQVKGYASSELLTEGHIILDTEEKGGTVKVYSVVSDGCFGFEDDVFTMIGGSSGVPTGITFSKNQNGEYSLLEYKEPMNSDADFSSLKSLFPEKLWDKVMNTDNYPDLTKQQEDQAKEYLKSIYRAERVSATNVPKKPIDIDVQASNNLFQEGRKVSADFINFPSWIGTRELIENGLSYIYETSKSKTSDGFDLMVFKKLNQNRKLVKEYKFKIVGSEPQLL